MVTCFSPLTERIAIPALIACALLVAPTLGHAGSDSDRGFVVLKKSSGRIDADRLVRLVPSAQIHVRDAPYSSIFDGDWLVFSVPEAQVKEARSSVVSALGPFYEARVETGAVSFTATFTVTEPVGRLFGLIRSRNRSIQTTLNVPVGDLPGLPGLGHAEVIDRYVADGSTKSQLKKALASGSLRKVRVGRRSVFGARDQLRRVWRGPRQARSKRPGAVSRRAAPARTGPAGGKSKNAPKSR